MSRKNTQQKLTKVRSPRVHISYDVEVGGTSEQKELPFVVGVVADLSAGAASGDKRLRDRAFVEIDTENFDRVMAAMKPALTLKVPDRMRGEGQIGVDLKFSDLDSFSPQAVAAAVPQLARMLETRARLNDLLAKLEGNEQLNELLAEVVLNSEIQVRAKRELDHKPGGGECEQDSPGTVTKSD